MREWWAISSLESFSGKYLAQSNWHNSSVGTDYGIYFLDPSKGTCRYLAESQFVAWSPDHRSFCAAPGRDLAPYGSKLGAKSVWVAPLEVVGVPDGKTRILQDGLIWVMAADWRKSK